MSDLLPLVAAVLKDKGSIDAIDEISMLKQRVKVSQKVEILKESASSDDENEDDDDVEMEQEGNEESIRREQGEEEIVVFASGTFEDGKYGGNRNLWDVDLKQETTCKLSDLRKCRLCVGGGFPLASLNDIQDGLLNYSFSLEGSPDDDSADEHNDDSTCRCLFCFSPHTTWLEIYIHGWPRQEWEPLLNNGDFWSDEEGIPYLVDSVAVNYPDATVEFCSVSFVVKGIHGALKRLLSPSRKAQAKAELAQRNTPENRAYQQLCSFVVVTFRDLGNTDLSPVFKDKVSEVLSGLSYIGIFDLAVHEEHIRNLVRVYEENGSDAFGGLVEDLAATIADA